MNTADMILDRIDLVKLDIHLWTSSKKLRPEDFILTDGSKLPPQEVACLGTKKTIDPKKLNEFSRIKKEAERICLETGTRFLGGFANPHEEIPAITAQLDQLAIEFNQAKAELLVNYEQETQNWVDKHPDFASAIRRAIEPVESVGAKLSFDYVVFRIARPEPELQDALERRTHGLSEQLFREIAQDANQLIERSFVGKASVTGRTLGAFRRMRDKLDSLGFLDYRCMPVVDEIDAVLQSIPVNGPYNGSAYHALFSLGLLLSDSEKIKRHGEGLVAPVTGSDIDSLDDVDTLAVAHLDTEFDVEAVADEIQLDLADSTALELLVRVHIDDAITADLPSDVDDAIPGFDAFLARYDLDQQVAETPIAQTVQSVEDFTVIASPLDTVTGGPEVDFMASVKETVTAAVAQASVVVVGSEHAETKQEIVTTTNEDGWYF